MKTPKRRVRFTGLYWMGFSDGKPHIYTDQNKECGVAMCKYKTHINYEDRRRVRITEVAPRRKR